MKSVGITWQTIINNDGSTEAVAPVVVDFTVDTNWEINPTASIPGKVSAGALTAPYMAVDNSNNSASLTVAYGPFNLTVPAFTRQKFNLTKGITNIGISGNVGQATVYFLQTDRIPDQVNYYAAQTSLSVKGAFAAVNNADQVVGSSAAVLVAFQNENYDLNNGFSPTTNIYTVPQAGYGTFVVIIKYNTAAGAYTIAVTKNGVANFYVEQNTTPIATFSDTLIFQDQCATGDQYSIYSTMPTGYHIGSGSSFQGIIF